MKPGPTNWPYLITACFTPTAIFPSLLLNRLPFAATVEDMDIGLDGSSYKDEDSTLCF
jgi:hypothetical protein